MGCFMTVEQFKCYPVGGGATDGFAFLLKHRGQMGETPATGTNHKGLNRDKWFSTRGQSGPPADMCQCLKTLFVITTEVAGVGYYCHL